MPTKHTVPGFVQALDNHLLEARRVWRETRCRTASTPGTLGNRALDESPVDYLDAISDLHSKLSSKSEPEILLEKGQYTNGAWIACLRLQNTNYGHQIESLEVLSPSLVWMLPAFCFSSFFLDPLDAKDRCISIQKTRNPKVTTDDIWAEGLVNTWASSDNCSFLLLQGNSQTVKRLEGFAVEIVEALHVDELGNPGRLVYILNPPPRQDSNLPVHLSAAEVLQQVVVQSLRYITPTNPVVFLVGLYARFTEASTSEDWFAILQEVVQMVPSLHIIVDLSILGPKHNEAQSWPASIQGMFNILKGPGVQCCLKVMLLSCRKITSQTATVIPVRSIPLSPTTPMRYRVRKRKTLSRLKRPLPGERVIPVTSGQPKRPDGRLLAAAPAAILGSNIIEQALDQAPNNASPITSFRINSPSPYEPRHRDDFKVGIVCALSLEADAVTAVFDTHWDSGTTKYGRALGDTNYYSTGTIGLHNVVLFYAPGMGKSNAASVAANCRASFKNIGLMLVVGICGGVPFPKGGGEIILGDVVISKGLVQYDFGRQFPDKFTIKGTMSQPKDEIKSLFTYLGGTLGLQKLQSRTTMHLMSLREMDGIKESAEYPGTDKDKLYEPTYRHKHQVPLSCQICDCCQSSTNSTCEAALELKCEELKCGDERLVPRKRLSKIGQRHPEPKVHFGHYASGDKVMKSGEERDNIAIGEGVIAFEMEGAGVWDRFPSSCLVIKGVCDYADSHKNKEWQAYASSTAAACTKAFLEHWTVQ